MASNEKPTVSTWTPQTILGLVVAGTGCLCLLAVVMCTMLGILLGIISPDSLGTAKGVGIGTGILGLAAIVGLVIKAALRRGISDG